jgi:hypothetical protein
MGATSAVIATALQRFLAAPDRRKHHTQGKLTEREVIFEE